MERVTVTITTDKPVSVKITPCKDALDTLLEKLGGNDEEEDCDDEITQAAVS